MLLVILVSTMALVTLAYFLYEFFGTYLYYCWNGTDAAPPPPQEKKLESSTEHEKADSSSSWYDDDLSSVAISDLSDLPMGCDDDDDDDDILTQTEITADVSHQSTV